MGQWKTVDEKSGAVQSVVEIYDQGGKLFGKIASLTKPTDEQGKPKLCTKCTGADKDKPIVGLIIVKGLGADGAHWKGGTILDPDDGKVYNAELWVEEGKLKVRGYRYRPEPPGVHGAVQAYERRRCGAADGGRVAAVVVIRAKGQDVEGPGGLTRFTETGRGVLVSADGKVMTTTSS